tara:strand:+ start:13750 stop:14310 length:561 start_codon:yes stop_codon:yes gene_type:complete
VTHYFIGSPGQRPRLMVNTPAEAGKVIQEGEVFLSSDTLDDFVITADGQALDLRVPPLDEAKAIKAGLVSAETAGRLLGGYTPQTGPLAGERLQTRESDQLKWLTSHAAYSTAVAAGQGAVMGADFRPQSNNTITVTYADGLQILLDMAAWGKAIMNHSWSLKDAIAASSDQAELDAIDITTGWPS